MNYWFSLGGVLLLDDPFKIFFFIVGSQKGLEIFRYQTMF